MYIVAQPKGDGQVQSITISTAFDTVAFEMFDWTTTPPTQEGWYWVIGYWRSYSTGELSYPPTVEFLCKDYKGRWVIKGEEYDSELKDHYEILGPLPVPEAPETD